MECCLSSIRAVLTANYYIKKEISQVNNPIFHLKKLEKEKHIKPKANKWKEITNIRAEVN